MSRAPGPRGTLWIAILASAFQTGCIHNHYYGTSATMPGCPPVVGSTVTTQVGTACEVPNGQVVATNPPSRSLSSIVTPFSTRTAALDSSAGPSRIVISQPASGPPSAGQVSSRFKWRKLDPETLPTMKAEGGLDESSFR